MFKLPPEHPDKPNYLLGAFFIMLSFLCMSGAGASVKAILKTVPVNEIVFFQNVIALILLLPAVFLDHRFKLKTKVFWIQCSSAVAGALSVIFMYLAIHRIPLAEAILLNNTSPIFLPLLVLLLFKSKVAPKMWWGILIGFVGIILILRPEGNVWNIGDLFGLISGICLSLGLIAMRVLTYTESSRRILFYNFLIVSLILSPSLLFSWKIPDYREWLFLIGIGIFIFCMNMFLVISYRYAKPTFVAPFNYFGVVFSGLLDWQFWGIIPSYISIIGIILVCIGAILSVIFHKRKNTPAHDLK